MNVNNNLGRYVQWQDGVGVQGGGHHTGQVVLNIRGKEVVDYDVHLPLRLVKESCDGKLTWVYLSLLKPWVPRCEKCQGEGCELCKPNKVSDEELERRSQMERIAPDPADDERGKLEPLGGRRDY